MSAKCTICGVRPADADAAIEGWCHGCCEAWSEFEPQANGSYEAQFEIAAWAAKRARIHAARHLRRHALNINVVGALVELRDAVLAADPAWHPAISALQKRARKAKGKVMEPLADVQKRARSASRRGGGR